MNNSWESESSKILQNLMNNAGISSLTQLSNLSGLSPWEISRLEMGLLPKLSVETLVKLAHVLQVSTDNLLMAFLPCSLFPQDLSLSPSSNREPEFSALSEEYQRLQTKLQSLEADLLQQWQDSSLDVLESWLIYWPTAIAAAKNNPSLPAQNVIRLVKPVQELIKSWGLRAIASVGNKVAYDPQFHELIEGVAEEGDVVRVRNVGYMKGDRLYLKAKVSQIVEN
jgi:transcriptional regulator with XRE-family HTH domain